MKIGRGAQRSDEHLYRLYLVIFKVMSNLVFVFPDEATGI